MERFVNHTMYYEMVGQPYIKSVATTRHEVGGWVALTWIQVFDKNMNAFVPVSDGSYKKVLILDARDNTVIKTSCEHLNLMNLAGISKTAEQAKTMVEDQIFERYCQDNDILGWVLRSFYKQCFPNL